MNLFSHGESGVGLNNKVSALVIGENAMKQRTISESQEYTVNIVFIFPNMTEVTALTFLSIRSLQVLIKEVINPEFPECFGPLRKTATGQFCFINIGG